MTAAHEIIPALDIKSIETAQIDGVWWARLNHHILGPVDGRSVSERLAVAALMTELQQKAAAFNRERYDRFRAKYPAYFSEVKTA